MKQILTDYLSTHTQLSKEQIQEFSSQYKVLTIPKNKYWIQQDETNNDIAFLVKGIFRVIYEHKDGEITLDFIYPNSFATAVLEHTTSHKSPWSFQALEECKLLVIDKTDHFSFLKKNTDLIAFYEKQLYKSYKQKESRLLSLLQLNAEERYLKLFSEHPKIFNLIPLKHIASSLGMTPETLSRIRNKTVQSKS